MRVTPAGPATLSSLRWPEAVVAAVVLLFVMLAEVAWNGAFGLFSDPLWVDEVFTVSVAWQESFADIFRALAAGVDTHPPVPYVLLDGFAALAGARSPEVLRGFAFGWTWIGLVAVYVLLRRGVGSVAAWVGVLAVWAHGLVIEHAFEGRFYALWWASAALLALALAASRGPASGVLRFVAVALSAALLCTAHWFGIVTLGLIVLGDRLFAGPHPSTLRALAGLAAGPVALLGCAPFLLGQRRYVGDATWIPELSLRTAARFMHELYAPLAALGAILVGVFVLGFVWRRYRGDFLGPLRLGPLGGLLGLAGMPIFVVVFSLVAQPAYLSRYAIPGVLALAPAAALAAARAPSWIAALAVAALVGVGTAALGDVAEHRQLRSARVDRVAREARVLSRDELVVFEAPQTMHPVCQLEAPCPPHYALLDTGERAESLGGLFVIARNAARSFSGHFGRPPLVSLEELEHRDHFYFVALRPDLLPATQRLFPQHRIRRLGGVIQEVSLRSALPRRP